jgi:hypothetical protein
MVGQQELSRTAAAVNANENDWQLALTANGFVGPEAGDD